MAAKMFLDRCPGYACSASPHFLAGKAKSLASYCFLSMRLAIRFHFTVHDNRHVSTAIKKLHHLLTLTRHGCPFGFGVRILFESTEFLIFKSKINLLEPPSGSLSNRILF